MATFIVSISGDEAVMAKLRKLGNGVLNLKSSMDEIGTYLTNFFSSEVFASRGGVIGEPWQPLNARYAVKKAKRWPGRAPLIRTGLMQRSFKKNAGRASVLIHNTAPHFAAHQGEERTQDYLPRRVMMKVDEARQRRIVDIIDADIERLLA